MRQGNSLPYEQETSLTGGRLNMGMMALWKFLIERTGTSMIQQRKWLRSKRVIATAQQFRQLRDIRRDPPRLVARDQLGDGTVFKGWRSLTELGYA